MKFFGGVCVAFLEHPVVHNETIEKAMNCSLDYVQR